MAKKPLPTFAEVRQLLRYETETGKLFWLKREETTPDNKRWNSRHAGCEAGSLNADGYRQLFIHKVVYKAHRVAWLLQTGAWPVEQIDHINRIRSDNRFENLREVSNAENAQNRKRASNNTSGYTGVCKQKNFWIAHIKINREKRYLGRFDTAEEAAAAYAKAKPRYHRLAR